MGCLRTRARLKCFAGAAVRSMQWKRDAWWLSSIALIEPLDLHRGLIETDSSRLMQQ
jgi:hypothetical protein